MNSFYFKVGIILLVLLISVIKYNANPRDNKYVWISAFLVLNLFGFAFPILKIDATKSYINEFGSSLTLNIASIFVLVMLAIGMKRQIKFRGFFFKSIAALGAISLINPYNETRFNWIVLYFTILQLFCFASIVRNNIPTSQITNGIFVGFKYSTIIQLAINVIAYATNSNAISYFIRFEHSSEMVRDNTIRVMGTFEHPGPLGLYCSFLFVFFLICFIVGYKKSMSVLYASLALSSIVLSLSRTSFFAIIVTSLLCILFVNDKRNKNKKWLYLMCAVVTVVFSMDFFSEQFTGTDSEGQVGNRFFHYILAYDIVKDSPIIGVGINSHLSYLQNYIHMFSSNMDLLESIEFFYTNPIHNFHLIIVTETGLIGLSLWLYYVVVKIRNGFKSKTTDVHGRIINITFSAFLLVYCLYGFAGWAGTHTEMLAVLFLLGTISVPSYKFID